MKIGLASRYASFVAVDSKKQTELKDSWMMMKSRDIPVQVAHEWGTAGVAQALSSMSYSHYMTQGAAPSMAMLESGKRTE